MLKKNKGKLIVSCVIILLPMVFGILMWNHLPETMAIHWGADGSADGFSGKAFAVFGAPLILLAGQLVCLLVTLLDKKQKEQTPKALALVFWIIPATSLLVNGLQYGAALGVEGNISLLLSVFLGGLFLVIGNYLPKIKQNSTIGIKIAWTLRDEKNWNRTHRFAGKVWAAGGVLILLTGFLPPAAMIAVMMCVIIAMVGIPMVYSYSLYRKHRKEEKEES